MKYNTKTKLILGILAGNLAVSTLVISYETATAKMLDNKSEICFGTTSVRQNCAECEEGGYACNKRAETSTVMLGAHCGYSSKTGVDPKCSNQVKVSCSNQKGEILKSPEKSVNSATKKSQKIENCKPTARYRCTKTENKTSDGKFIYVWADEVENPSDPDYPTCGKRNDCTLDGILLKDPTCKIPDGPK